MTKGGSFKRALRQEARAAGLSYTQALARRARENDSVDRRVGASYEAKRLEELDLVATFDEVLSATLGLTVPPDVVRHVVALDHSAYSKTITVSPENLETLRALRERGLLLGLVSNVALLPDSMRADLDALGILGLLDATVFSSEVGTRKPDPRIFREALAGLGVDPEDAVFVGDRLLDDVQGAQGVGMRAVQTREFRQEQNDAVRPDAVVERLTQVPDAVARLSVSAGGRPA